MMAWLRKITRQPRIALPEIPDDLAERREKLAESQRRLAEAEQLRERSNSSAEVLQESNRVNHYIRRLEKSYASGGLHNAG